MGGDEFVILSVHDNPDKAVLAETAMRRRLQEQLATGVSERACSLSLSNGTAAAVSPAGGLQELLTTADADRTLRSDRERAVSTLGD